MLKLRLARCLEVFFEALTKWAERERMRFAFCPNCGRNRYTGEPCFGRATR